MDIYSAEAHVKKLLAYVEELADSRPRMYSKSKERLRELAVTCNSVVTVISEVLQDQALVQDDEFDHSSSDTFSMICSMQDELSKLRKFVNYAPDPESTKSNKEAEPANNKSTKISVQKRKHIMSQYGSTLSKLAQSDIPYKEASDCAKLLWTWFDRRFFSKLDHPSGETFRYNIRRISDWIVDIVLLYGYHVKNGTLKEFSDGFYGWCDSLLYNEGLEKFAVPHDVYLVDTDKSAQYVTLESVVIWDILLDFGLRTICTDDPFDMMPSEDSVYQVCGSRDPDKLTNYRNYVEDSSILSECNIHGGEGR